MGIFLLPFAFAFFVGLLLLAWSLANLVRYSRGTVDILSAVVPATCAALLLLPWTYVFFRGFFVE